MDNSRFVLMVLAILFCFKYSEMIPEEVQQITEKFNDFKRRVNYNLLELSGQIITLFDRLKDLKETIKLLGADTKAKDASPDTIATLPKTVLDEIERLKSVNDVIEVLQRRTALLYEAFVSEKRFIREQRQRIDDNEDAIMNIYQDVATNITAQVKDLIKPLAETIVEKLVTEKLDTLTTAQTTTMTSYRTQPIVTETTMETITTITSPLGCEAVPSSGVYKIYIKPEEPVSVFCRKDADDGGWIVFLRRQDGSENFNRPWVDYKNGFGKLDGEFWAGNDLLHELTESKPMRLRVHMEDFDGKKAYAEYDQFQIGSEDENYKLTVSGYSGTAGDSLIDNSEESGYEHNGMQFTTVDMDNDGSGSNCAESYSGGWWFNRCFSSHLTGIYSNSRGGAIRRFKGVIWHTWRGWSTGLKTVEMKIR